MTPTAVQPALPADWRDLVALTKPRVMSLVVFTGLCGLLAAPERLPLALGFTAILCIALAAGAAGALNQWYESDLDAKMRRTANRPASDDLVAARGYPVEGGAARQVRVRPLPDVGSSHMRKPKGHREVVGHSDGAAE